MPMSPRPLVLVAASALVATACTRAARLPPVTVNEALPSAACPEVTVDTAGWLDTFVADLGIELELPPSFRPEQLGVRQRPGWGSYVWLPEGRRTTAISARVIRTPNDVDAERQSERWEALPDYRACTFTRGEQSARVVAFDESDSEWPTTDTRFPPHVLIAEWAFTDNRIVRLTINARTPEERDQLFAVVQTVRFTDTPQHPARCSAPFNCGQIQPPRDRRP